MWQTVITGPVLQEGRVLCPCMAKLLCCAADSRELVSTETSVLDLYLITGSSKARMLGLFPFPQTVFSYCSFSSLLIFLLSCLCSYVSWLRVLVYISQAFTDFHFPHLFYSSVIDSCPVPDYYCCHSYQEVLLSLPPFFSSASPTSLHSKSCFVFYYTIILVFSLSPSS